MLLESDLAVKCSCSLPFALSFGAVNAWGIISNILILVILIRSGMIKENIGTMLANEAVCDTLINIAGSAMVVANVFQRRIAVIGVPIIVSLSCVRVYCLLGISFSLYMAICHCLKYRIHLSFNRIVTYSVLVWILVPAILLVIYLEGTFYDREEPDGYLQIHYTLSNFWVGIFIVFNGAFLPFTGIIICAYKTLSYQKRAVYPGICNSYGSAMKIRLAKMSMLVSITHVLSQIPSHLVSGLHVRSPVVVSFAYMLLFLYPSGKFFIHMYMLKNFRKTLKSLCGCRRRRTQDLITATTSQCFLVRQRDVSDKQKSSS